MSIEMNTIVYTEIPGSNGNLIAALALDEAPEGVPPGFYDIERVSETQTVLDRRSFSKEVPDEDLTPEQIDAVNHVEKFFAERAAYKERGLPHKRGIILTGKPGTGKTTVLKKIIADSVSKGRIVLQYSDPRELVRGVRDCRISSEIPVVVVYEDFDEVAGRHDAALTEVLDGVDANVLDNFAFVVTTNYLNLIPDRLRNRPGRFDDVVAIPFPTEKSRRTIVNTISGGKVMKPEEIEFLVTVTANFPLAHMREIIMGKILFGKTNKELLQMAAKFKHRLHGSPKKNWFQKLLPKFKKENDSGNDE